MIKKFIQGDGETDANLYCLICRLAINPKVHQALGVGVSGIGGDIWYLHLDGNQAVDGFAQVRVNKDKHWPLRFLYAEALGMRSRNALVQRVLDDAKADNAALIFTNDRDTAGIWKLFNFTPGDKKRGTFIRWEKTL